jgi:hypothetical protein
MDPPQREYLALPDVSAREFASHIRGGVLYGSTP